MARPWDSLSTLRSPRYRSTTPDSLPVAGQALPDGIGYPQGSAERFQKYSYTSSSFPKLLGAMTVYFYILYSTQSVEERSSAAEAFWAAVDESLIAIALFNSSVSCFLHSAINSTMLFY